MFSHLSSLKMTRAYFGRASQRGIVRDACPAVGYLFGASQDMSLEDSDRTGRLGTGILRSCART